MSYPTAVTPAGCNRTHIPGDAAFLGAVLQAIDCALVPVAHRYGHNLAEDVHVALLRRLDTGLAFASVESWCDETWVIQTRAIDAWVRQATWGEAGRALRRRGHGDPDWSGPEDSDDEVLAAPVDFADTDRDEVRQVLVAVRRASRSARMRPVTRDLALRVLEARLEGATYANAARHLGMRTNTAVQYVQRLRRSFSPKLNDRLQRALKLAARTGAERLETYSPRSTAPQAASPDSVAVSAFDAR